MTEYMLVNPTGCSNLVVSWVFLGYSHSYQLGFQSNFSCTQQYDEFYELKNRWRNTLQLNC